MDTPAGRERARRGLFERLAEEKVISTTTFGAARDIIERRETTANWLLHALLVFGIALILVGMWWLLVEHWSDLLGRNRLYIVIMGNLACLVTAIFLGVDSTPGRTLLVANAIGVGIFLAVFGDIYVAMDDDWLFLVAWTALMAPFIVVARSQFGWLVFAVVATLAALESMETGGLSGSNWAPAYPLVAALLASGFWTGLAWWRRRDVSWLDNFWSEYIWCAVVCVAVLSVEWTWYEAPMQHLPWLPIAVATALMWHRRLRHRFDMGLAGCTGLTWLGVSVIHVNLWLRDTALGENAQILAMAFFVMVATVGLVWSLRRLARRGEQREDLP